MRGDKARYYGTPGDGRWGQHEAQFSPIPALSMVSLLPLDSVSTPQTPWCELSCPQEEEAKAPVLRRHPELSTCLVCFALVLRQGLTLVLI